MNRDRRCWLVATAVLTLGGTVAVAAEPDTGIALSVRRLGRLPSNASALPADVPEATATLARERGGWPWVAYREPLLTNADLISAQVVPVGTDDADAAPHLIRLMLTPRASLAWGRATRELIEQDVGVFLDDQLQGGITIRTPITSGRLDFRVHRAGKLELQRIAAGVMRRPVPPT